MAEYFVPNKQRLRGIDRLEIEPRDFEASARFWRRLGFTVTIRGEPGRREATLRAGDLRVLFREPPEDGSLDRRRSPFTRLRVAISVRDFDAYVAELREKDPEGVPTPEPSRGIARAVELVDPNGIRILLEEAVSE